MVTQKSSSSVLRTLRTSVAANLWIQGCVGGEGWTQKLSSWQNSLHWFCQVTHWSGYLSCLFGKLFLNILLVYCDKVSLCFSGCCITNLHFPVRKKKKSVRTSQKAHETRGNTPSPDTWQMSFINFEVARSSWNINFQYFLVLIKRCGTSLRNRIQSWEEKKNPEKGEFFLQIALSKTP